MSNTTATEKKQMVQVFAMWKAKSAAGKTYFTGKTDDGAPLTGFYVTNKKNLKEPDIRIYKRNADGDLEKEVFTSLWCNSTKKGKKILSGKVDGKKVVGFINDGAKEKAPYFSVYWSDEEFPAEPKKEEPKKAPKKVKEEPKKDEFEELKTDEDLPF